MRCSFLWVRLQRHTWAFIQQWFPIVLAFALGCQTQIFLRALPILYAGYAISKPDILTQIERGEEPCPAGPWDQEKGSEEETVCPRKPNTSKYWHILRLLGQCEQAAAFLGRPDHLELEREHRPLHQGWLHFVPGCSE